MIPAASSRGLSYGGSGVGESVACNDSRLCTSSCCLCGNRWEYVLRELRQNGSPEPEFEMDEDRTYLNTIIHIRDGFENKVAMSESMSELMSELERARMQVVLGYLNGNKKINSVIAAELLGVEVKTASRLLSKAEKLEILKGEGKTKNKVYSVL